ncbi:sugar ABC transporter substrate-binding protein [Paenibacillus hamazuiensis]|uniref:sugar ABC transporter substrate-binding protein n=1 Tax=Paenibacillus hamazuiensis TaxID=2936508 RepID=UPI00200EDC47|nr:substrate-binding domain-containing protein [Paenibacillus hamazuiensis]
MRSKSTVRIAGGIVIFICIAVLLLRTPVLFVPKTELPSSADKPKATAEPDSNRLTFGVLYPTAHPFYESITESIEEAAKPQSIRLVVKAPDEYNVERQIQMMETMIKQKVNGIAIDPIDPNALTPLINKAVQEGIPVICFESDAPQSRRLAYLGNDPFAEGNLMGKLIDRELKGKGMILVEAGHRDSAGQSRRLEGMLDYLSGRTDIQVLDTRYHTGLSERAINNLEAMIDDHPHFDALVDVDWISSSSSIIVWKAQGLRRRAFAFGLTPEVKEAVINGQITSVVSQNEDGWGTRIIELLRTASEGKSLPQQAEFGMQEVTGESLSKLKP